MRITNSMMVSQFLSDANSSLNRLSKYQNQVDSTKRISSISDDPQATLTALKARNRLNSLADYQSNIGTVKSYLNEAEGAAGELNEILQSAYEQVVSATGGSKNENDLSTIAEELKALRDEVVQVGNTTVGTSYLFGGYNFAGTSDGASSTPPFSVQDDGHLIYNTIDLTKLSWAEDFTANAALANTYTDEVNGFDGIDDSIAALSSASSDSYARDKLCAGAMDALDGMAESAQAALDAAEKFGIDPGSDEYKNLSDMVDGLNQLRDGLYNECAKELAGDSISEADCTEFTEDGSIDYDYYEEQGITVLTQDEMDNRFSIDRAKGILEEAAELIGNTDSTTGVGLDFSLSEATGALQTVIDADTAGDESTLSGEAGKNAKLWIGGSQTADFTFAGTQLLGSGKDNVYYILDKCVSLLQAGDTDGLKSMISDLQGAQSRVLSFQTEIGANENRMDLISSRYDSSTANYTEMQSDAVDADMAEAILNFTTAQTVYNAALAAGAEIVQTSLIDFLS